MPAHLHETMARCAVPGGTFLFVTFTLSDGSGTVGSYAGSAPGCSVAYASAAGKFTITLPRGFKDVVILGGSVGQADATALLHVTESQTEYVAGALTYEVRTKVNEGTLTNPASGDRVTVLLWANERGVVAR